MSQGWEEWQNQLLDEYLLGYTAFETQEQLADEIGKSLNAVKIKLSRRRLQIEEESRELTFEEYKLFLSNRFDKTTKEIADIIGVTESYLLEELDEIDCLEAMEFMEKDYQNRIITLDEIMIFIRLYNEGKNSFQIAQILNRSIERIQEMIEKHEGITI